MSLQRKTRRRHESNDETMPKRRRQQLRESPVNGLLPSHTNDEDMAIDATSDSDCFTDVVNVNKLRNLIQKMYDPEKVLEKLLAPEFGFLGRLKRGSIRTDLTELLIQVIAMACNSKEPDQLTTFLKHINGSRFLRDNVVLYLNRYLSGQEAINMEVLIRIIEILKRLVTVFPSRSLDIVTQLFARIQYLQNSTTAEISLNELDQELKWAVKHRLLGVPTRDAEEEKEFTLAIEDNFKCISIAPTCEDIRGKGDPYLRKNKVFTRYTNVNDYLDVQFRLLREDLIRPLREGVADILESRKSREKGTEKKRKKSVLKVYQKVQIVSWRFSPDGIIHKIHFDTSRLKRVRWGAGKRFIFGSIVCLSADQFQTMLIGTIAERNPNDLSKGIVFVNFENEHTRDNSIQFNCCSYEMIESPAYYEPYKSVLGVLQYLDEKTLPFQKYLLNQGHGEIPPPNYIRHTSPTFNFTSALKQVDKICVEEKTNSQLEGKHVCILTPSTWPTAEQLGLDDSQYGALKVALTKEFAVIQGPPGTGKTFIGVLIVQLLLANKYQSVFDLKSFSFHREPLWDGPIMIVCYTNHALDQFLEEIIKQHPSKANDNKIVRLGSRCSSENERLKRCQISEIMRQPCWRIGIGRVRQNLSDKENQLTCLAAFVELAREELLHENVLKDFMSHGQFEMLTRFKGWEPSVLLHWLYDRGKNAWQSNLLNENDGIREETVSYEEQWEEQVGRQSDVANKTPVNDFVECKKVMRENAFLRVLQNDTYFKTWQSLRKIHNRFQQARPFYDVNIWALSLDDRWRLYKYWVSLCIDDNMEALKAVQEEYSQEKTRRDAIINLQHRNILRDAEIIGMTTTAAAKHNQLLKTIKSKIVIVEEAAEVLEAHIVASLSRDCEHLILIGDHQQLRPKPADDRLAKHYWLHISLFERMLLNKMNCECLSIQHRMRPEISKLLVPHIYKSLRDHSNVHEYENIAGVMGNLFFLNHSFEESRVDDLNGHSNEHEASFIAAFCKYLLNIGYSSNKITVLTAYTGQLFLLRKHFPKKDFEGVRITPVDNYQGEENDIILLSLVRSNKKNDIGFLGISNRVCVALSRARKGLYIFGNGNLLRDSSPLWRDILDTLKNEQKLVEKIPLGCRKHPDNVYYVSCAADFSEVPTCGCKHVCNCPLACGHVCERTCHEHEPGHKGFKYTCNYPCEYRLDCGHVCERHCHVLDPGHDGYKCMKPCLRKPEGCRDDHSCTKMCHLECGNCPMPVQRTLSRCQHTVTMECHIDENDFRCMEPSKRLCPVGHRYKTPCSVESCVCTEPVKRTLVKCQHEVSIPCTENERLNERVEKLRNSSEASDEESVMKAEAFYYCHEPCKKSCASGHPCAKRCYENCNALCTVMTEKILPACQHKAVVACNIPIAFYQCQSRCEKTCGASHQCTRLCSEACGKCEVLVIKTLPVCSHEAKVPCYVDALQVGCKQQCEKRCPVGHRCVKKCGERCGDCAVQVEKTLPRCRHTATLECHEEPESALCQKRCEKSLSCGHQCQEICQAAKCSQFCSAPVDRTLPCGHVANLLCYEGAVGYLCCEQVEVKTCEDGHTKMIDCHRSQDKVEECTAPLELTCSTKFPSHNFTIPCHTLKSISEPIIGCPNTCNVKLDCGHLCREKCEDCARNEEHPVCHDNIICNKQLPLCLHKCESRCGTSCPPCLKPLAAKSRCPHAPSDKIIVCSKTTELCNQRCKWSCPHYTCDLACWKPCNRPPCNRACGKILHCGHYCLGLCGEPCPRICRQCDRAEFAAIEKQLPGVRLTLKSRFVVLRPCSHVVESNFMDDWVDRFVKHAPCYVDSSLILTCPICKDTVIDCPRYNKVIKGVEWRLSEVKRRSTESKLLKHQTTTSVECWLRINKYNLSIVKKSLANGKYARLRLGTICILYEIKRLSDMLVKRATVTYSPTLDKIGKQMVEDASSCSRSSIAVDVITLYRIYIELRILRLKEIIRGPNLKIILRCKLLMDSLPPLDTAANDLLAIWETVEKVNTSLITKLNRGERMDDIDDYILHLNRFYDTELNASWTSLWMCCSKGHVYPSEETLALDMIDYRCPLCCPVHDYYLPKNLRSSSTDDKDKARSVKDETILEHPAKELATRENVSNDDFAKKRKIQPSATQGIDSSNAAIKGSKRHDLLSVSSRSDLHKKNKGGIESLVSDSRTKSKISEVISNTSCRSENKKVVQCVIEKNETKSRGDKNNDGHSAKRSSREPSPRFKDVNWSQRSSTAVGETDRPCANGINYRLDIERNDEIYENRSQSKDQFRNERDNSHLNCHNKTITKKRSYSQTEHFAPEADFDRAPDIKRRRYKESATRDQSQFHAEPGDRGRYGYNRHSQKSGSYERADNERGKRSRRAFDEEEQPRRTPPSQSRDLRLEHSRSHFRDNVMSSYDGTSSRRDCRVSSLMGMDSRGTYINEEIRQANKRSYAGDIHFSGDDDPYQREEVVSCTHPKFEDDSVNSWMNGLPPHESGNYTVLYERESCERSRPSRRRDSEQRLRQTSPWRSEDRQSELGHRVYPDNVTSSYDGTSSRRVRSLMEMEPRGTYFDEESNCRSHEGDIYFPDNEKPSQRDTCKFLAFEHSDSEDDIHLIDQLMHGRFCRPGDTEADTERNVFTRGCRQHRTQPMNNGIWNSDSRQSNHTNNPTHSYSRKSFRQFMPSKHECTRNKGLDKTVPTASSSQACDRPLVSYDEEFFDSLVVD